MGIFRLFLALSVLLGHTRGHGFFGLPFLDRDLALQTFFIISGFYMALVLNEKYTQPGRYWTFIQQRFLRLYPTYLLICLLILLVDGTVYFATGSFWGSLKAWHDFGPLLSPGALIFMGLENIFILGQDWVMLLQLDQSTGSFYILTSEPLVKPVRATVFLLNGPGWSLAVEFCFYLLAPFLVCRTTRVQLGILLACFLLRLTMFYAIPFDGYHWIYSLFAPNLFYFMCGSVGYILYKNYASLLKKIATNQWWIIALFSVFALFYCRLPFVHSLYLVWLTLAALMIPLLFALTSRSRVDRLIGELSYPSYLIHAHVLIFTVPYLSAPNVQWLIGPVSVAMTVVLAYLFYQIIETRTEHFRESLYKRSRLSSPEKKTGVVNPAESSTSTPG